MKKNDKKLNPPPPAELRRTESSAASEFEDVRAEADVDYNEYFNKYWRPYFNHIQIYNSVLDLGYKSEYPFDGTRVITLFGSYPRILFALNDGTVVFIVYKTSSSDGYLNSVYIDVNGSKNPNKLGKDVFMFAVSDNDNIKPYCSGMSYSNVQSHCINSDRRCCAAKILADGREMKDDYPW